MTNYFCLGWEGGFCFILKTIIVLFFVVLKNENEIDITQKNNLFFIHFFSIYLSN